MFSVFMGHLGSDEVAANSVANIVKNIIECLCYTYAPTIILTVTLLMMVSAQ